MAVFNRYSINLVCAIILFCSNNAVASDDEYLKLLEAEAIDSRLDRDGQRKNNNIAHNASVNLDKRDWAGECDYVDDVLPSGLVWEEFSSYLKQCSLGTYVFYRRLEFDLQRSIYNTYSNTAPTKNSILKEAILKYF